MNVPFRKTVFHHFLILILILSASFVSAQQQVTSEEAQEWADKTLAGLSLEKKIAQIICTDISGEYIAEDNPQFVRWIQLARDVGVGSFVLYGGTPRDVAHLLNRLQRRPSCPS